MADLPGRGLHRPDRDGSQLHRRRAARRHGRPAQTAVARRRADDAEATHEREVAARWPQSLTSRTCRRTSSSPAPSCRRSATSTCTSTPGETLGLVGESGCGKSMTGLSIMGLLPPGGSIVDGSIKLDGRELVGLHDDELRQIRGNEIAMIFQDPLTSLDPTKTIGYQVAEPVRLHRGASQGRGAGPGGRGAGPGRPAPAEGAAGRLPAPAVRRPAPAGDDRHGAGLRAEAAHRRRADHRAGRHHPGADPRPARRT